jgi:hypothetical protein
VRIKYCAAPCGSGKTHQIVNRACELVRAGERVLVLQPTKELIEKTVRDELLSRPMPPRYHVYHGNNVQGAVAGAITEHFNNTDDEGQLVFATHAVLSYVPYWANKREWHVLIDEDLQVLRHKSHQLPQTHSVITDHIDVEAHNSIYGRVVVTDLTELREKGRNKDEDELFGQVAEAIKTLTNPHWESFVNIEQYDKLRNGLSKRLSVHSVLKPGVLEGFGSIVIAGANFEDTVQFRLWSDKGVRFKEDQELCGNLRFQSHRNGHLVDIHYAMESPWSRKRREASANPEEHDNNLLLITRAAANLFGTEPFVWQANKEVPDRLFGPNSQRLPNKPHGLNTYDKIHNIAFLSALNPNPDHFRFLESVGVPGDDVRTAVYYSAAYQAVMRTSIRDAASPERKRIVVPDRGLAEYLQARLPGSRVHRLEAGVADEAKPRKAGRPRKHQSNKKRVAEQRAKAKAEKVRILNGLISLGFGQDARKHEGCVGAGREDQTRPEFRAEKGIKLITNFGTQLCSGTLYPAKNSPFPSGYLEDGGDIDFFVDALKALHGRKLTCKEQNALISPAVFDPGRGTDKKRGLENIVYTRHVWLDFEDGDLGPGELAALFPRTRMLVVNSYNHRSDKPRFRVVTLLDRPLTPAAHELVFDNIARKIEDAGYFVNRTRKRDKNKAKPLPPTGKLRSGLDWSKRTPASLFYLPCQAAESPKSFYIDFDGPEREILNPLPWIENSVVPVVSVFDLPEHPKNDGTKVDEALLQQARDEWRQSHQFPQEGNDRFFDFARALRRAGLSPHQIQSVLQTEAAFGRSPKERRAQVKSIMSSLARRRRRAS